MGSINRGENLCLLCFEDPKDLAHSRHFLGWWLPITCQAILNSVVWCARSSYPLLALRFTVCSSQPSAFYCIHASAHTFPSSHIMRIVRSNMESLFHVFIFCQLQASSKFIFLRLYEAGRIITLSSFPSLSPLSSLFYRRGSWDLL